MRNASPRIVLNVDVPKVDDISMNASAGPLWPAVDSLRQNLFYLLSVLSTLLPLAELWPPLSDHSADNRVNPMYTVVSNIRCIIWLVTKLLLVVVKLKGQENVLVVSAGPISSASNQILSLKLDPALSFPYIHCLPCWAAISILCPCLKNSCVPLPSQGIWVWTGRGYGD
jgi:hypothetical protein